MGCPKILIVDEDEDLQDQLMDLLERKFSAEVEVAWDKESAIQKCKEQVYDLIVIDPILPASFEGEDVIREQRQFYSINIETPILIFTEDIDFLARMAEKYGVHIESKQGPVTKIINPVSLSLSKNPQP